MSDYENLSLKINLIIKKDDMAKSRTQHEFNVDKLFATGKKTSGVNVTNAPSNVTLLPKM